MMNYGILLSELVTMIKLHSLYVLIFRGVISSRQCDLVQPNFVSGKVQAEAHIWYLQD